MGVLMVNFITCTVSTDSVGFGNLGPDQEQEKNENLRPSRTVRSFDLAVHESLFEIGFSRFWYLSPVRVDRKSFETPI